MHCLRSQPNNSRAGVEGEFRSGNPRKSRNCQPKINQNIETNEYRKLSNGTYVYELHQPFCRQHNLTPQVNQLPHLEIIDAALNSITHPTNHHHNTPQATLPIHDYIRQRPPENKETAEKKHPIPSHNHAAHTHKCATSPLITTTTS
jgi:hypothetical protein